MTLKLKLLNDKKHKMIKVKSCDVGVVEHSVLYHHHNHHLAAE